MYEPAHDNTYMYNKTCVTSKDSDRPVHPPSMARVFVYPSLDSPEPVEGAFYQQSFWSDLVDAKLIQVFVCRTSLIVGFVMRWLI